MSAPSRLVISTHNRKKASEMITILSESLPHTQLLTLSDFPGALEPVESGTTYNENARIKAECACAHTGEWCLADDAGLEIDFLDGAPGVYSKRYGGEELPFPDKIAMILNLMSNSESRSARFRCSVALSRPGEATILFQSVCEGQIARVPVGDRGFGYDSIFYFPQLDRTFAELAAAEKHRVSHRGHVLRQVAEFFQI